MDGPFLSIKGYVGTPEFPGRGMLNICTDSHEEYTHAYAERMISDFRTELLQGKALLH